MISAICQEFGCTPAEALRQPRDLTLRIVELRRYAEAKHLVETAKSQADIPADMGHWTRWVMRVAALIHADEGPRATVSEPA